MLAPGLAPTFETRLRAWLLARPVAQLCVEERLGRRSVYDWLAGEHLPRGLARRWIEARVEAWEQARAALEVMPAAERRCWSGRGRPA